MEKNTHKMGGRHSEARRTGTALGFIKSLHPEAPHNHKLFNFGRVHLLDAGSTTVLSLSLTAETVALVRTDGSKWILPGRYYVEVAGVNSTFQVTGEPVLVTAPPPVFVK